MLTKEDFAAAALEKTRRIDILDFVKAEDIDDRFFDKPYYLTPGKGGDVAYGLLREAIRESGRIGIAKFIMREVQHLAAVEVVDEALVLSTLRFADELVDAGTLGLPKRKAVGKKELDMATTLVESLAAEWSPEKYTDDYRENLMRVIKAKMKGKKADLVVGGAAARRQSRRSDGAAASEPRCLRQTRARGTTSGQQRTTQDDARGSQTNVTHGSSSNERRATTSRVTRYRLFPSATTAPRLGSDHRCALFV